MGHHQENQPELRRVSPARDTIAAVATPRGIGGVGIVRISGPAAAAVGAAVAGDLPPPRTAAVRAFSNAAGEILDRGIAVRFPSPGSFTGEDVVELHGHGGFVVLDMVLEAALQAGARLARPGEFSERAFLNGRIDLVQAEAVADLIESSSRAAARLAMKSLAGEFSKQVEALAARLESIRVFVEAALDFPEEEIGFLDDGDVGERIRAVRHALSTTLDRCDRGAVLRDGFSVALCGAPNAGKSSLLNRLARRERAIVSDTPGTTRDLVEERVLIDGVVVNLTDTAGLRAGGGEVEREGIRRARVAMDEADLVLLVHDDGEPAARSGPWLEGSEARPRPPLTVHNKIDLTGAAPGPRADRPDALFVSAKTGAGIEDLERRLAREALQGGADDNLFLARRRHLEALRRCLECVDRAVVQLSAGSPELMADDLRLAHRNLSEITGAVTTDDLLGKIFSSFCIGK